MRHPHKHFAFDCEQELSMSETHADLQQFDSSARELMQEGEAVSFEELLALNLKRATTYAMLARLYRIEIDQQYLAELRSAKYPVATGNESADTGYHLIAKYVNNLWENSGADLARDFTRSFIGQGMNTFSAAYPYESVYTSQKRLLMQDARDEVLALLRSEGFDKNDTWKETEDHIALELEFMQVLALRTVDALRADNEHKVVSLLRTQHNFLVDHLVSWTPLFTADVRRFAQTTLYQGLAYLTDGFLQTDREFLEGALAENAPSNDRPMQVAQADVNHGS
jgi:TorA maturation chaperone TorD